MWRISQGYKCIIPNRCTASRAWRCCVRTLHRDKHKLPRWCLTWSGVSCKTYVGLFVCIASLCVLAQTRSSSTHLQSVCDRRAGEPGGRRAPHPRLH